ncbi:D-2-hydroxyacid dehydrogenase [Lentibacillus sp. CBA3610]|uniref:D-2-hydroxyacid dehydrogenase n=1 Tax=Lentibacillus sp. CBA3610 TaxID=2518176 RepID=UPI0015962A4E|nr:D-2-hydroxyacid dehydrogenase [Lentibacillus sp. CBA3610]QKY68269.1 D-2-hydroxyacid dehydrogenase [Lentibacillus sp. CBA3610]
MITLFSAKISEKHQTRLRERYPDVTFIFCKNMDEAEQHIDKAGTLVTYGEDLTAGLIGWASQLKWIMVLSAGIDRMPFEAISTREILVTNARGIHKYPMAEYAFAMLLQVNRQAKQLMANETAKNWDRSVRMEELTGKTMLIAGTGAIGQEVARLAKAFRMTVYGVSRSGRPVGYFDWNVKQDDLENLLPEADYIVSVLPSTPETKGFFTTDDFRKMPSHAVFLNMGRGDAVSDETILNAVRKGEIVHAVLDVFEEEPLPEEHPFWTEENITVTPHLSGVSSHYQRRALDIFDQNLQIYLNNGTDYVNKIDVTRGY